MADTFQDYLDTLEAGLLGGVVCYPEKLGAVITDLRPELFREGWGRDIWLAILDLHNQQKAIDPLAVNAALHGKYKQTLTQLVENTVTASNIEYYAALLVKQNRLSQIQTAGMALAGAGTLEDATAAVGKIEELCVDKPGVRRYGMLESLQEFVDEADGPKPEYIEWGVPVLDKELYTEAGDFIVIGGYPSSGKTLLALQAAVVMGKSRRVGFYSCETSAKKIRERLIAHLTHIPLPKIKSRDLNEADWAAIAGLSANPIQLDVIESAGWGVPDIRSDALSRSYDIVIIDYLQLIHSKAKNRYEQVTEISQALHTMAASCGITVIALAQLVRPEKTNGKPVPPSMSSLRESGQIEQDADAIMLLWPSDPNDNKSNRVLKIAKNKEGERAKVQMLFDGPAQTLTQEPSCSFPKTSAPEPDDQVTFREIHGDIKGLPF